MGTDSILQVERNNREGTPSEFGLNDKQYADLSKIIHEAFKYVSKPLDLHYTRTNRLCLLVQLSTKSKRKTAIANERRHTSVSWLMQKGKR